MVHARAAARQAGGEQAHRRHALELARGADHRLAHKARQRAGLEHRDDGGRGILGAGDVLGREEQEGQVGGRS